MTDNKTIARYIEELGELKHQDHKITIEKIVSIIMTKTNNVHLFGKTVDEFVHYYLDLIGRYETSPRCVLTSGKQSDIDNMHILKALLDYYGFQSLAFEYFNNTPCAGFIGLEINSIFELYSHINVCRRCSNHYDPDLKNTFIPSNGEVVICYMCGSPDFIQQIRL